MHSRHPFAGAVWIVAVGAGLGIGYNALRPQALSWVYHPPRVIETDFSSPGTATPPLGEAPSPAEGTPPTGTASDPAAATAAPDAPPQRATLRPTDPAVGVGRAPSMTASTPSPKTSANPSPGPASPAAAEAKTPAGETTTQSAPEESVKAATKDLYPDIPQSVNMMNVGLAKAKEFYDRGGLLVLDARDAVEFADGHIKGAVSAPYDDVVGDPDLMSKYAADPRPILCYCSGGECELSMDLGEELTRTGHRRVLVLKDGYPGWKDAGYPVSEGASQ